MAFEYTKKKIDYKGHSIQTYQIGDGNKVIFVAIPDKSVQKLIDYML